MCMKWRDLDSFLFVLPQITGFSVEAAFVQALVFFY